jgi:hypothetical protein
MQRSRQVVLICAVLAVHVAADFLLLVGNSRIDGGWSLFLLALPFSQGSLIAIWAAVSRMRSYLRFPAALLGLCWIWFLTVTVLDPYSARSPESAGWAATFAIQALCILILTTAGHLAWRQIKRRRPGGRAEDPQPLQFSLRFLMLWTTLLAVILGVGQFAFAQLGWTSEVVEWQYFWFCPVLGACNAVFAVIVLVSLVGRAWLIARILLAVMLVGVLGYSQWHLFVLLFADTGGLAIIDLLILAGFQAVYLYATLLPLRLCGCFGIAPRSKPLRQPNSPFAPAEVPEV